MYLCVLLFSEFQEETFQVLPNLPLERKATSEFPQHSFSAPVSHSFGRLAERRVHHKIIMTGGVEYSSDSGDTNSSEEDSPPEVQHFKVDHTETSQARADLLASLRISTLSLPLSNEYPPAQSSDSRDDDKHDLRMHYLRVPHDHKWGFAILRCTYSSDALWTEYLKRIRDHIAHKLNFEQDDDLRAKLEIPIFESPILDGLTWMQARDIFDAWALEEVKAHPRYNDTCLKQQDLTLHLVLGSSPRTEFFVYADEASVNSVVNSGQSFREIRAPGAYYFTVVATGLRTPRVYHAKKDGTPVKDYEGSEETREALRQKWKANEYVGLYAYCMNDNWPDIHENDKGGVSRCF